jgi:hypothetical protein
LGLGRTPAKNPSKSDQKFSAQARLAERGSPLGKQPAKSDLRAYLLSGPKVDEFEIEPNYDSGREIEL